MVDVPRVSRRGAAIRNVWTFFTADCQEKPPTWLTPRDHSSSLDAVRASVNILRFWSTANPWQITFFLLYWEQEGVISFLD